MTRLSSVAVMMLSCHHVMPSCAAINLGLPFLSLFSPCNILKITTFRKLSLLPSSDKGIEEWKILVCLVSWKLLSNEVSSL
jgi:hypothetical protein